jgi:hypothetical protein
MAGVSLVGDKNLNIFTKVTPETAVMARPPVE